MQRASSPQTKVSRVRARDLFIYRKVSYPPDNESELEVKFVIGKSRNEVTCYLEPCKQAEQPLAPGIPEDVMCPRHDLCLFCNNRMSRRKSGELTKICSWLQEEVGVYDWGILTVTLPGNDHWVRDANLGKQYRYMTEKTTSSKGVEPMRGLQRYLRQQGVEGGFTFLEATFNSEREQWHLHAHMLLVSRSTIGIRSTIETRCAACHQELDDCLCSSWAPRVIQGEGTVGGTDIYEAVGGGWNRALGKLGYGIRTSYDDREPGAGVGGFVKYCTQLAYLAKPIQFEEKIPAEKHDELSNFFRNHRPRMIRRWGIARQSKAQREDWDVIYHDRNNI